MKVLYTGSFNPFHNGHQYIFDNVCKCFGKENVWIGVSVNPDKNKNDLQHIRHSILPITQNVICYDSLTADIVKKYKFDILARGIRPYNSLEYEYELLTWNKELCGIDTILLTTPSELSHLSSSAIRILDDKNQDVLKYMNSAVYYRWKHSLCSDSYKHVYFGRCCTGKSTYLSEGFQNIIEMDKIIWNESFLLDKTIPKMRTQIKKAFYDRDVKKVEYYTHKIGEGVDWKNIFSASSVFDFPNIGTYWEYIPTNIRDTIWLHRVDCSDDTRLYFAADRAVNPMLLKINDMFYKAPPFWDEDIAIITDIES